MSLRFSTILQVLTTQWMSREEIERRVGGPCMSQLTRLHGEGPRPAHGRRQPADLGSQILPAA